MFPFYHKNYFIEILFALTDTLIMLILNLLDCRKWIWMENSYVLWFIGAYKFIYNFYWEGSISYQKTEFNDPSIFYLGWPHFELTLIFQIFIGRKGMFFRLDWRLAKASFHTIFMNRFLLSRELSYILNLF